MGRFMTIEEHFHEIVRNLVRMMGYARTWQEIVEISMAIDNVHLILLDEIDKRSQADNDNDELQASEEGSISDSESDCDCD